MMKKYILFIVVLVAAISCNKVENIFRGDSDKVKIVINGCEGDGCTKSTVIINTEANANVSFGFETNDLLGVFPDVDYSQQLKLKAVSADKDGKSFSGNTVGWLLNGEKSYAAYYPFNADYHQRPDNIVFSYKGQKQIGNGNTESNLAHLGGYTFLYSKPVRPSDNSATFGMNNASAFLHIRHFSENGGTFTKMTISAKDGSESIPTALKANLFPKGTGAVSDTVAIDNLSTSIAVNLDNYTVEAKQNLNVWCALPPVDLSGDTLVFKFFDADGNVADFFEKPGQDMTLKNTDRWTIHNFIEQVYALKYHANAEGATFADGATDYSDIVPATEPSHTFTIIGTDKEPTRSGYKVKGWSTTESGGVEYSLSGISTITISNTEYTTSDATKDLYAVWEEDTTPEYTISVAVSSDGGGTVSIDDTTEKSKTVKQNESVKINAVANSDSGYEFDCWKIGDEVVTNDDGAKVGASYTFNASANVTYTAYFKATQPQADGSLPEVFTINADGDKVKFSQGNLQYQASTNTWRFAEHQYDFVGGTISGVKYGNVAGSDNTKISETYDGWIDLFGWGTSGFNTDINGNSTRSSKECYQPWSTKGSATYYYISESPTESLSVDKRTDWGCNEIKVYNGKEYIDGKPKKGWRTLTGEEWNYIIGSHDNEAAPCRDGNRFIHCHLTLKNEVKIYGILLFPDGWKVTDWPDENGPAEHTTYSNPSGSTETKYRYNFNDHNTNSPFAEINEDLFNQLQGKGVVFLPETGYRSTTSYSSSGKNKLYYYAANPTNKNCAHFVISTKEYKFHSYSTTTMYRYYGMAVRLVTDVNK